MWHQLLLNSETANTQHTPLPLKSGTLVSTINFSSFVCYYYTPPTERPMAYH